MTDKELLELAAKAAGIEIGWDSQGAFLYEPEICALSDAWNPLENDAQALRLAVKLGLDIRTDGPYLIAVTPRYVDNELYEERGDDPYAATRRAIVRAASEIGRTMG